MILMGHPVKELKAQYQDIESVFTVRWLRVKPASRKFGRSALGLMRG